MSAGAARAAADRPEHAGPAPWPVRVLAQARWDVRAMLGNGEQLLLLLVLPALVLVVLSRGALADVVVAAAPAGTAAPRPVDVVAPGVLALAVMSTAFTGQAIATGFDRRAGVLRLLGTTPLGRGGLLAGRVLAVLAVEAAQALTLGALAVALGWRPDPAALPAVVAVLAAGTAAFVTLGLLLAGTLRAEAVLAAANLAWVLLLVGGGVVLPPAGLPEPLATLAPMLPSGALGEGVRAAVLGAGSVPAALGVLAAWTAVAGMAAARWFRWD